MQDTVYDKFVALLVQKAKELVIGDGFDEKSGGGPVVSSSRLIFSFQAHDFAQVSKVQYDKVWRYIENGKDQGAKLALGGEKRPGKGFFVDPTSKCCSGRVSSVARVENYATVFTDIKQDMQIVRTTLVSSENSADMQFRSRMRYFWGITGSTTR